MSNKKPSHLNPHNIANREVVETDAGMKIRARNDVVPSGKWHYFITIPAHGTAIYHDEAGKAEPVRDVISIKVNHHGEVYAMLSNGDMILLEGGL